MDVTPDPWPAAILAQPPGNDQQLSIGQATEDGHLTLLYGNYGTNTGPIDVIGYRPSDGDLVTYLDDVSTEQLWNLRKDHNGDLWAGDVDPRGSGQAVFITSEGGWHTAACQATGKSVAVHAFDLAPPTATDPYMYACGARDIMPGEGPNLDGETAAVAFVWASNDGGATWTEVVHDQSNVDGYHRCYGFGRIGSRLFVFPISEGQDGPGEQPHVYSYWHGSGTSWTRITGTTWNVYFPPVWGTTTFAVDTVVLSWNGSALVDVTESKMPGIEGYGNLLLAEGDNYLYATHTGIVRWTDGTVLGSVDNYWALRAVRSTDGELYLSDRNHIYRYDPS